MSLRSTSSVSFTFTSMNAVSPRSLSFIRAMVWSIAVDLPVRRSPYITQTLGSLLRRYVLMSSQKCLSLHVDTLAHMRLSSSPV